MDKTSKIPENVKKEFIEAIQKNDIEKIKELINKNKELVNLQLDEGKTILMMAASIGEMDLVKLILDKKPDVNIKDDNGLSALAYALMNEQYDSAKLLIESGRLTLNP